MRNHNYRNRFHIIENNFLETELEPESFDIITNISVIEHFEGNSDSIAMKKSAKLLKKGGIYILTTLINEGYFREFYVSKNVYGEKFNKSSVFYQRHYDLKNLEKRIIKPAKLTEIERIYFGDYGLQFFEKYLQVSKFIKILYSWIIPSFAVKFLTYNDKPISRKNMKINTSSGVILIMQKK